MQLRLPHIELDAINWQAGWRDLTRHDPDEFVRRVADAIAAPCWVADGNYGPVREIVWGRATHLVWLDYDLGVVMRRVVVRSVYRLLLRTELWAGNRERWMHLFSADHPIRWAWSTHTRRGIETAERLAGGAYPNLCVVHLRHPREAPEHRTAYVQATSSCVGSVSAVSVPSDMNSHRSGFSCCMRESISLMRT